MDQMPEAFRLVTRVPHGSGLTHTTVAILPECVEAKTQWEDLATLYRGPIQTDISIERCERLIAALEIAIAGLRERYKRLSME